jgi:hypothetical protein
MKYFIDTEFDECIDDRGQGIIWLISIGIVSENGRQFYAECADFDWISADPWLLAHVKPHLSGALESRDAIRDRLVRFVGDDGAPEFWAYVGAYDWIAMIQLFGGLLKRPVTWPKRYHELKDLIESVGLAKKDLPVQSGSLHNALADAEWNRQAYFFAVALR